MRNLIVSFLLPFSTSCFALTGNELLNLMEKHEMESLTYVQAIVDFNTFLPARDKAIADRNNGSTDKIKYICSPDRSTVGQAHDVVKKYLLDNPETRNLNASLLVTGALLKAWPCE